MPVEQQWAPRQASNICRKVGVRDLTMPPFLTRNNPITPQELLHGCAMWDCTSLLAHAQTFIWCPWRYIQWLWSSSDLQLSFELSVSSKVSLQVQDRRFHTSASHYETCSLSGGDCKAPVGSANRHLHCLSQCCFHIWSLFGSLSSFQIQSEQNPCSGICSSLLRPWSIHLDRHKHPYSHHGAHLKISQVV